MLKVLIADDEENGREATAEMLKLSNFNDSAIALTESVSTTISGIKTHSPDVVLLDIEMKDGTAFDVLKHFPYPTFKVIFITAYKQYAVDAFRFSALDYLLKPLDPFLLTAAINKAVDNIEREKFSAKMDSLHYNLNPANKEKKRITLRSANSIHIVNLQDILYCEADRSYTNFNFSDGTKLLVSRPLDDYDTMFQGFDFVRIHRSFIVNMNCVKRYDKGEGGTLILNNNAVLPVSARKREHLLQLLANL